MRIDWATDPEAMLRRTALGVRRGMARGLDVWTRKAGNNLRTRAEQTYRDSISAAANLQALRSEIVCRSPIGFWREYGTGLYGPRKKRITAKGRWYTGILGRRKRRRILHWVKDGTEHFAVSVRGMKKRRWFWPVINRRLKTLQADIAKQIQKQVARLTATGGAKA